MKKSEYFFKQTNNHNPLIWDACNAFSNILTIYYIVADFFIYSTAVKSIYMYFFCKRLITTIISIFVKYS